MNENKIIIFMMSFIYIIIILNFYWIDVFSKRGVFLGVGVGTDNEKNPEVAKIRKEYKKSIVIFGILSIAAFFILEYFFENQIIYASSILPLILVMVLVYFNYRKKLKEWKNNNILDKKDNLQRVDLSLSRDKVTYGNVYLFVYIIPIMIVIAISIYTFSIYDKIPSRIPTHYDFYGTVTRYESKSIKAVFSLPLASLVETLAIMFANYTILAMKQRNVYRNAELGFEHLIKSRRIWTYMLLAMAIGLNLLFSFMQLMSIGVINNIKILYIAGAAFFIISLILPLYIGFKIGSTGDRIDLDEESLPDYDDDNWRFGGTIYYNKKDPAIFVAKRVGIGSTINFGNRKAVIILTAFILTITIFTAVIAVLGNK